MLVEMQLQSPPPVGFLIEYVSISWFVAGSKPLFQIFLQCYGVSDLFFDYGSERSDHP